MHTTPKQRRKHPGRHETHKQNGRSKVAFPSAARIYDASVWALELDIALLNLYIHSFELYNFLDNKKTPT
ncbi:hypothetical protein GCM10010954_19830 [Halobacillus andaensis]|uniref:Uncharacterized protein n=1 Tax=Halobacillus andaensis TaxID=1176239 RepID=A0A917B5A9_HALAA|nr:hypothetical protein GCM10010954_19830 [Halobacillus andaensis]